MRMLLIRSTRYGLSLVVLVGTACAADVDFERDIAPILLRRCVECHQHNDPSGSLILVTREGLLNGGESGPAAKAGHSADSYLLQRVIDGEMPPPVKGVAQKLAEDEIAVLTRWIDEGAEWPEGRTLDLYEVTTDVRGGRDWWAFQPIAKPDLPQEANGISPIDWFVRQKLIDNNLSPAPPAHRKTLIRRLHYSVTGLMPSLEDVQSFSDDSSPEAWQTAVDRQLASKQFGVRWARYWLDLVRFAETSGYERDQEKLFAWKYRDWVVDAINSDMPFDEFALHQLAGDEIENRNDQSVIATGFLRLGTWNDEPNDDADYQYERLEDMVHATSSAFLGLTVKCARCHDHKFDPIPQVDYYRVASVFWPGSIAARDRKLLGGPSAEELGFESVFGWTDLSATPSPLHVLKNGERHQPREVAEPGPLSLVPDLFATFDPPKAGDRTTGRRRQLANWIVQPKNPLTARVAVNRIWQHHFGHGLVRSPNNFGYKGDLPTHPKLLDWLAAEFIESGWSSKHIHRLILNSDTWQQSSLHPRAGEYELVDSANRFLWRSNRRRLDAESLRDAMLLASGSLDLSLGGESFRPTISEEALEGLSRKTSAYTASPPEDQHRRSLYIYAQRSLLPPLMTTFDQCDTTLPCGQRDVTTVPTQALALLNNEFAHDCGIRLASAAVDQLGADSTDAAFVEVAWQLALRRVPTEAERRPAVRHILRQRALAKTGENEFPNSQSDETALAGQAPQEGLTLHLDAGVRVETDENDLVMNWEDLSPAAHHAGQENIEYRPRLVENAISGRSAVRFDGESRFLRLNGQLLTDQDCTILAVALDNGGNTGLREIVSNWNGSAGNSTTSVFLGLRGDDRVRFSDAFTSSEPVDISKPFLLTALNGDGQASIRLNGGRIGSLSRNLPERNLQTNWVIGQQGNIDGEYWAGDVAEIYVYGRVLSENELEAVTRLLLGKYGIPRSSAGAEQEPSIVRTAPGFVSLCHVLLNSSEFLYVD